MTTVNSNSHLNHIGSCKEERAPSARKAIIILVSIFCLSVAGLLYLYKSFPDLEEHEAQFIKLPTDIEDAKNLGRVLARYQERYYFQVLLAFFLIYVFLQSFAIPGSIFLSILSGFLFPFPLAIFLVCTCSALGASCCYVLSSQLGRKVVQRFFPERAAKWAKQVKAHEDNVLNYMIFLRITPLLPNWIINITSPVIGAAIAYVKAHEDNLLNYMIFLRITPLLPNWFINITSPVIGVPAKPFILGTFLGVAPPSFVFIQAGTTLYQMTSSSDAMSLNSFIILGLLGVLSILPVYFRRKVEETHED